MRSPPYRPTTWKGPHGLLLVQSPFIHPKALDTSPRAVRLVSLLLRIQKMQIKDL